jgi:hypothetical protein
VTGYSSKDPCENLLSHWIMGRARPGCSFGFAQEVVMKLSRLVLSVV